MDKNGYEISPETLNKFRTILERNFRKPLPWTDDQIKDMAWSVLCLLETLRTEDERGEKG